METLGFHLLAVVLGHLSDSSRERLLAERRARAAAESSLSSSRGLLDPISDGLLTLDQARRITDLNRPAQQFLGVTRTELVGRRASDVFPIAEFLPFYRAFRRGEAEGGVVRFEERLPGRDQWLEVLSFPTASGGLTVHCRDVTARRLTEERLRSISLVDELTGLYNRRGFLTLAEQQRKLAIRRGRSLTLVFVDLDDLKVLNDTRGHPAGDRALITAAAILKDTFRESDVVGRIGGDEFAGLAVESGAETAHVLIQRLEQSLARHNDQAEPGFPLRVSFGTATFDPRSPSTVAELISFADSAMYDQKRGKRNAPGETASRGGEADV